MFEVTEIEAYLNYLLFYLFISCFSCTILDTFRIHLVVRENVPQLESKIACFLYDVLKWEISNLSSSSISTFDSRIIILFVNNKEQNKWVSS